MEYRYRARHIASVFAVSALTLLVAVGLQAQGAPNNSAPKSGDTSKPASPEDKLKDLKVSLDSDHETVSETIRTLMKSAKLDFVIDNELKGGTATVHLKDLPFNDALATVIKVSTIPIKYELKDGIYHFMLRPEPPPEVKPQDADGPIRPRAQIGKVPLSQIGTSAALRKLYGPYDVPPPMQYQHSSTPVSHGGTSSFGLNGNGVLGSNGVKYNPDGSVSHTGTAPLNILNMLKGLLGGFR